MSFRLMATVAFAASVSTGCIGVSVNKPAVKAGVGVGVATIETVTIKTGRQATIYYLPASNADPGHAVGVIDREENGWVVLRCPDGEKWIRLSQIQRIDYP